MNPWILRIIALKNQGNCEQKTRLSIVPLLTGQSLRDSSQWITPNPGRLPGEGGTFGYMADSGLNSTAAALLGLLHEGPMTGGQLMSTAQRRLGAFWSMTRSQVYRELPALADAGLVRMGKPGPRASQPYAITAAGKRAFSRWLAEPPGREAIRNPVALRVAFGVQSTTHLPETYESAQEHHTEALVEAREASKVAKKEGDAYAAAAYDFAVAYHRAALSWLKSVPGR